MRSAPSFAEGLEDGYESFSPQASSQKVLESAERADAFYRSSARQRQEFARRAEIHQRAPNEPDFMPGRRGALTELASLSQDVQLAATDLHAKLVPLLPDTSDGAWTAWPYLQLQLDLATSAQILAAVREGKPDRARELLLTRCTVLKEDKAGDRIFGVAEFRDAALGSLRDIGKRSDGNPSVEWFESLVEQLTDAASERLPTLRWCSLMDRSGTTSYAPVLLSWRRMNSPRMVLFDVYFLPHAETVSNKNSDG